MDLLEQFKTFFNTPNFVETKSFYYTYHNCENNGQNTKVELNFRLSSDLSDEIIKIGKCKYCNTCFYHKDFDSKTF